MTVNTVRNMLEKAARSVPEKVALTMGERKMSYA